jgi:Ca2+-binding EF-hand superfamily protein
LIGVLTWLESILLSPVERLFEVIDKDGSGFIGYSEFIYGLAILLRGSRKEKLKLIFDLYDLSEYV